MKAVSFFKRVAALLLLNALVKPLWIFGVDRQVQNLVGHAAYGGYFSVLNLCLIFSFVTDAGLSNMANRQLASGMPLNAAPLLRLKGLLAVLYALLAVATAWATGLREWAVLLPVIGLQILLSLFNFLRSLITAHQLFGADALLSVLDRGLLLLFFLPLLYTHFFEEPITIPLFLYTQLASLMLATAVAFRIVVKRGLLRPTAAVQKAGAVLKGMAPYALIILVMTLHNRLDGFLLERLHPNGAFEAGVYAASYRLLDVANVVGYLVASFLVPFLARHRAQAPLLQETVLTARHSLLLFGLFASLFLTVFAAPVQQSLYTAATAYTAQVLQWCLPVLPAYLLLHVYGSVLTAMAQLKPFLLLLAVAVVVNALLNVLLIPYWGAIGCCVAALASQYLCAVSVSFFAAWRNGIKPGWRQLLQLAATGAVLAGLFFWGRQQSASPVLLLLAGGAIAVLSLIGHLSFFKRYFILLR